MENGLFPVIRASQASCPCSRSHSRSDSGASRLVRNQGRTDTDAEPLCDAGRQLLIGQSGFGEGRVLHHLQHLRRQFRGPATTAQDTPSGVARALVIRAWEQERSLFISRMLRPDDLRRRMESSIATDADICRHN